MPTARSVALSIMVNGNMEPDFWRPHRRSISSATLFGVGTDVYQSFQSSPSLVASTKSAQCDISRGTSVTCVPLKVTGCNQVINVIPNAFAFGATLMLCSIPGKDQIIESIGLMVCCGCARLILALLICSTAILPVILRATDCVALISGLRVLTRRRLRGLHTGVVSPFLAFAFGMVDCLATLLATLRLAT